MNEKRALGKGLGALISPTAISSTQSISATDTGSVHQIPIAHIKPNKYQPRFDFKEDKLNELISSIREKGVVQPVLVRKVASGYELIAGERRMRAAQKIGLEKIPAIIKDVNDLDMLELALIENIQRDDLNPIEEARSYEKFITEFNFTQEKIAQVIGKDRTTIANMLRLLTLPDKVQNFLLKGSLTTGHAKAILGLPASEDQVRVANVVVKKNLSVRETESIISRRLSVPKKIDVKKDANIVDIETALQQRFGTRVRINHGKKRGTIVIDYYSNDDLNRILGLFIPQETTLGASPVER